MRVWIAAVVAVAGAFLLLRSTAMGMDAGGDWLRSMGGSAPTATLELVQANAMEAYRLLGAILLGGGLLGALLGPWKNGGQ